MGNSGKEIQREVRKKMKKSAIIHCCRKSRYYILFALCLILIFHTGFSLEKSDGIIFSLEILPSAPTVPPSIDPGTH